MFDALKNLSRVLPYLYAAVAIVVLWQLALILTGADPALLPPPLLTAETFIEILLPIEVLNYSVDNKISVFNRDIAPAKETVDAYTKFLKEAGILKPDDNPKFDASFAINALKQ